MTLTRKQKWLLGFVIASLIKAAVVGGYFLIHAWWNPEYSHAQLLLPDQSQITVEVADSWSEQQHGLMGRESLAAETGMLFIFDQPGKYPFWMKNTKMDLDYIWLLDGTVVELTAHVPAGDGLPTSQIAKVSPKTEVDWVLEVPAGFIAQHQLQVGDRLDETPEVF